MSPEEEEEEEELESPPLQETIVPAIMSASKARMI
jgi:hypothetical protein